MPSFRSALRNRLLADPAVAAIADGAVDFVVRPEESDLPAVVLEVTADPRPDHFTGPQGLRQTRLQIDCFSAVDTLEAVNLAEACAAVVRSAVADFEGVRFDRGTVAGPEDSVEQSDALKVYRARLDCHVWHALV